MTKLIDAEELKESFRWSEVCRLSIIEILNIIDKAPEVDITKKIIKAEHKAYNEGFKDGVDQGIKLSEVKGGKE